MKLPALEKRVQSPIGRKLFCVNIHAESCNYKKRVTKTPAYEPIQATKAACLTILKVVQKSKNVDDYMRS